MRKILTGDTVYVRRGKDKGKTGIVLKVISYREKDDSAQFKLVVDGINIAHKHVRGDPNSNTASRIEKRPMPIAYANVRILNLVTNKPDKVQVKTLESGDKVRVYRSTGEQIPSNVAKKERHSKTDH